MKTCEDGKDACVVLVSESSTSRRVWLQRKGLGGTSNCRWGIVTVKCRKKIRGGLKWKKEEIKRQSISLDQSSIPSTNMVAHNGL
jgi:hypothetical protein